MLVVEPRGEPLELSEQRVRGGRTPDYDELVLNEGSQLLPPHRNRDRRLTCGADI